MRRISYDIGRMFVFFIVKADAEFSLSEHNRSLSVSRKKGDSGGIFKVHLGDELQSAFILYLDYATRELFIK